MNFKTGIQRFRFAAVAVCLAAWALPASAQTQISGTVRDAVSEEPIPLATVLIEGTTDGVACDVNGEFVLILGANRHMLRVSAIGYVSQVVHIDGTVRDRGTLDVHLKPSVISHDEVVVNADAYVVSDPAASIHNQNATEDLMDRLPGADFIQRANFAWEPVIRGMSGGQVGLVIDGIKVIGACIDKMDPTSAYVEVENLERLDLTKGGFDLSQGSQIGGTINMVTEKPSFDHLYFLNSEVGFESASTLRRGRVVGGVTIGNTSLRGSFSHRVADDFAPGGHDAIKNSGYRKNNYKLDVAQRLGSRHTLTASMLADNAWGVGYPVLLMDATLAEARIYSLTHTFAGRPDAKLESWETRVYYNTVDHWMDDYDRDVLDRVVMRGMNMPMFGQTRTGGLMSTLAFAQGRHRLGVTLDYYRTTSFADMWMFSILEEIPDMYLLNLGDTVIDNGAVSVDYTTPIAGRLKARVNGRLDVSLRDVEDGRARTILQGEWDVDDVANTYVLGGASVSFEYTVDPVTSLRLSLAHVARLPTHVENYGHYVYNYVDGAFYTGNPDLNPERSNQAEVGIERLTTGYGIQASFYVNDVGDYILGLPNDEQAISNDTYRFRFYRNLKGARLFGFEVSGYARLAKTLSVSGTTSYTHGQNLELDEPMQLISPLTAMASLRYDRRKAWAEVEARMAMPQNRVATLAADEEPTDGYFVLNARGSVAINDLVSLRLGIENILDAFYHEHLSIGNLPNEGRNIYASVSYSL